VFYERWTGPNNSFYEIYLGGIFYNPYDPACATCPGLIQCFYQSYMHYRSQQSSTFLQRQENGRSGPDSVWSDYYTPAKCVSNDVKCDNITRCCKQRFQIYYGHYEPHYEMTGLNRYIAPEYLPPCQSDSCTPICGDLELLAHPCDLDCDTLPWTADSSGWLNSPFEYITWVETFPVGGYWDTIRCQVQIFYHYRNTTNCIPNHQDARLDSILTMGCLYGVFPNLTPDSVYLFAVSWLMRKGHFQFPTRGNCQDNYRFISAPCWASDTVFVNSHNRLIPCAATACCWAIYKICISENYDTTYTMIESGVNPIPSGECEEFFNIDLQCIYVCDYHLMNNAINTKKYNFPLKSESIKKDTYIINPKDKGKIK
jgi:hypothetical protein